MHIYFSRKLLTNLFDCEKHLFQNRHLISYEQLPDWPVYTDDDCQEEANKVSRKWVNNV